MIIQGTGSRRWQNIDIIDQAFLEAVDACSPLGSAPAKFSDVVFRHGGASGFDRLAAKRAKSVGMWVEEYPADWGRACTERCDHGPRKSRADGSSYCTAAGPLRNLAMVNLTPRPSIVLAFMIGGAQGSPGTFHCATAAQMAGLSVWWFEQP